MKGRSRAFLRLAMSGLLLAGVSATASARGTAPALLASDGGRPEPLTLSRLAVDVRIVGPVAETRMTMSFFNPHDRELSGDLYFPLPEGATVSGYALDVNGVMVDGGVVEKEKGRRVFETLARRRVDPGLVEWVKGNHFKTRVFPIPARGGRTVMVRYLSELFRREGALLYRLPLGFSARIGDFSLRAEVAGAGVEPRVRSGRFAGFAFAEWRQCFVAETHLRAASLPEDLLIEIPDAPREGAGAGAPRVAVEKSADGMHYFVASCEVPDIPAVDPPRDAGGAGITVFWDASGSRGPGGHQRELDLLKEYLASLGGGEITVRLILFRNECEAPLEFPLRRGGAGKLLSALKRVGYDGGTAFDRRALAAGGSRPLLYLLFSDGVASLGGEAILKLDAPLFVFSGSAAANHPYLHHLAESNGGRYANLVRESPAEAARAVGRPPLRFSGSEAEPGRVGETYPRTSRSAGRRFVLAGRLEADEADLTLSFARGAAGGEVRVRVARAGAAAGELLRTFWAQKKIEDLMTFSRRNGRELVETGKAHGLVTPGTSLIVLEDLEQYVEHRIAPPESLPEMRRQYFARLEGEDSERQRLEADHLDGILALWSARLEWWRSDFSSPPEAKNAPPPGAPAGSRPPVEPRSEVSLAQAGNAVVEGEAFMPDGTPLPGAVITLSGTAIGEARLVADEQGRFAFRQVPSGAYDLKGEMEGFRTAVLRAVRTRAGEVARVRLVMDYGTIQEMLVIDDSGDGEDEAGGSDPVDGAQAAPAGRGGEATIALQAWDPQAPYVKALQGAAEDARLGVYLEQRRRHGAAPGFFLDCADFFFAGKKHQLGLRVLSNIAELGMEDAGLLRILGHRLRQLGYLERSAAVFEEVLALRPDEPQSHRDLALVLAAKGDYARAVALLWHVVRNGWERFDEIELIALNELNRLIVPARAAGVADFPVPPPLAQPIDLDVRVVMTWDSDMTDVDLWVTEPGGERAFFGHNLTAIGGLVSQDFTEGYGPEEYLLRRARPGTYKIEANYYGSDAGPLLGPVTVQVDVFTDWGRPGEKKKSLTLRLSEDEDVALVGEIEFQAGRQDGDGLPKLVE